MSVLAAALIVGHKLAGQDLAPVVDQAAPKDTTLGALDEYVPVLDGAFSLTPDHRSS